MRQRKLDVPVTFPLESLDLSLCNYHHATVHTQEEQPINPDSALTKTVSNILLEGKKNCLESNVERSASVESSPSTNPNYDFHSSRNIKPNPSVSVVAQPSLYDLYAIISHRGAGASSLNQGHYISYVKQRSGRWIRCDDEDIMEVSAEEVAMAEAYLLFYINRESAKICENFC